MTDPKTSTAENDEGENASDAGDSDPAAATGEEQAKVNEDRESPA